MTPFLNLRSQLFLLLPSLQIEGVVEALKLTHTVMQQATQEVSSIDIESVFYSEIVRDKTMAMNYC